MEVLEAQSVQAGRERLRSAMARVIEVFVSREGTAEEFATWSGIAETYAARLEGAPPESVMWGLSSRGSFAVEGLLTPAGVAAPPAVSGDTATAVVTFGAEQEGHRTLAHGGTIADTFDHVFTLLFPMGTGRVFTAELSIRYLRPVPLARPVQFEVEVVSEDGNRRRAKGRASIDGVICVEADGEFVLKASPEAKGRNG